MMNLQPGGETPTWNPNSGSVSNLLAFMQSDQSSSPASSSSDVSAPESRFSFSESSILASSAASPTLSSQQKNYCRGILQAAHVELQGKLKRLGQERQTREGLISAESGKDRAKLADIQLKMTTQQKTIDDLTSAFIKNDKVLKQLESELKKLDTEYTQNYQVVQGAIQPVANTNVSGEALSSSLDKASKAFEKLKEILLKKDKLASAQKEKTLFKDETQTKITQLTKEKDSLVKQSNILTKKIEGIADRMNQCRHDYQQKRKDLEEEIAALSAGIKQLSPPTASAYSQSKRPLPQASGGIYSSSSSSSSSSASSVQVAVAPRRHFLKKQNLSKSPSVVAKDSSN